MKFKHGRFIAVLIMGLVAIINMKVILGNGDNLGLKSYIKLSNPEALATRENEDLWGYGEKFTYICEDNVNTYDSCEHGEPSQEYFCVGTECPVDRYCAHKFKTVSYGGKWHKECSKCGYGYEVCY